MLMPPHLTPVGLDEGLQLLHETRAVPLALALPLLALLPVLPLGEQFSEPTHSKGGGHRRGRCGLAFNPPPISLVRGVKPSTSAPLCQSRALGSTNAPNNMFSFL